MVDVERRSTELIKVCVRLRPLLKPYEDEEVWAVDQSSSSICTIANPYSNLNLLDDVSNVSLNSLKERDIRRRYADTLGPQSFTFDYVYGPEATSQQIYQQLCRPIVHSVLSGYNGTIFMYGQTTSGKTYTMLGTPESPGVLPCSIRDVFQNIAKDLDHEYSVWVSYLEIYNEQINDLLVPGSTNLKIKEDPKQGVTVQGLKQQQVWSFDQVIILMNYGEEHRSYRETSIHEHSSRSHTIFKIFLESVSKSSRPSDGRLKFGCLNLVDLAGSERLGEFETRAPDQLGETGHINKSLFVLANVINKLAEGRSQHIPYRDSKLTRILSQALGGNSLTAIVCTVSPAAMNFHQSLSTLRFATRAKTVHNAPEINEILDEEAASSQYKAEISRLREELKAANAEVITLEKTNAELLKELQRTKRDFEDMSRETSQSHVVLAKDAERWKGMERAMERQRSEMAASQTDLTDKYQRLLDRLQEERKVRMQYEKELEGYKQALAEVYSAQHGTLQNLNHLVAAAGGSPTDLPKLQLPATEGSYVDSMVGSISSVVGEVGGSQQWRESTRTLAQEYRKELLTLQEKYSQSVKGLAKTIAPQKVTEVENALTGVSTSLIETIRRGEVCKELPTDFSHILDDFLRSGSSSSDLADIVVERLKEQHELFSQNVDQRFEETRAQLETFFREKVSKEENDAGTITALTSQHSDLLKALRAQYEDYLQELETAYVNSLRQFDSYFVGKEQEEEEDMPVRKHTSNPQPTRTAHHSSKLGEAFLWGSGKDGRIGIGSEDSQNRPVPLMEEPGFLLTSLVCGYHHSAAITEKGELFTWGRGVFGQLGHGNHESYSVPMPVSALSQVPILQVSCGWQHSLALSQSGQVYSWGYGDDGQLGQGSTQDYITPTVIPGLRDVAVVKVACGHSHTGCIAAEGEGYMWGLGPDARLFFLSAEPTVSPVPIHFPSPITAMSLGVSHSAVVTEDGAVYAAGVGSEGQLGQECQGFSERVKVPGFGQTLKAREVSCGDCYTLILDGED